MERTLNFNDLPQAMAEVLDRLEEIQKKVDLLSTSSNHEPELMGADDAAEFLHIAKPTLYNKINNRSIPHFKFGGKLLFRKSDLMEFLETGIVKTRNQMSADAETEVDYLLAKTFQKRRKK